MVELTQAGTADAATGRNRVSRRLARRAALALALLAGTAAAADYGYQYWTTGRFMVSTDDAYAQADYTTIAPKISGYIAQVLVRDNQAVGQGQVLARIDDRDYRTALAQADAAVGAADAQIRTVTAELALQRSVVAQKQAQITAAEAALTFARQDDTRYAALVRTGAGTVQRAQQASSTLRQQQARLDADQAGLTAAERQTGVLAAEKVAAEAQRARAQAAEHQAALNLSYTTITAPVAGTVGARTLRVGQYVQAGTQLMAVVPLKAVYVVANFKETQLTRVRPGQPVTVAVDSFPGVTIRGHVDSLAPASGQVFALLPPDNATGNFTKIVQRLPVKIAIDDHALAGLLRPGMSVEPDIDTRSFGTLRSDVTQAPRPVVRPAAPSVTEPRS